MKECDKFIKNISELLGKFTQLKEVLISLDIIVQELIEKFPYHLENKKNIYKTLK